MSAGGASRRTFLAAAGGVFLAIAGRGIVAVRSDAPFSGLSQRLWDLFDRPVLLKPFGARALAAGHAGSTIEAIAAELADVIGWADGALSSGRADTTAVEPPWEQLAGALAGAMVRDFRAGDTVVVDGWLLSRTELRLVALAGLDPSF